MMPPPPADTSARAFGCVVVLLGGVFWLIAAFVAWHLIDKAW